MPEERKLVTILFADISESTALGDTLDPEDVRALMSRYYDHARRTLTSYGGTLEKFIGDAVMGIFGLLQTHGDDAERALAAALALREAITTDEILGPLLRLRIGINTGEIVATGDPTTGDFLVTGDAVNVSARLQQGAHPGEIIVSERTMHATENAFLFADVRLVQAKGKPQPLRVFPLLDSRPKRQVEHPPFVGRRQDLLQLTLLKERTLEEKRPQLISILAPAGTGKSRLLEEFLHGLDPAEGFRAAFSRCLPYGQTLTFWPLRGLLTELLDSTPDKQTIQAAFLGGGYTAEDATRLADLVMMTLGVEAESTTERESIFAAWRLLIEILSIQAPRILIFEDLHWASDSLLDFVEHISSHLHISASLLLITLSRPELLDRRPTWGSGRQNFSFLALQPLGDKQTGELISRLSAELPEAVCEQIVSRSGGNPFFALELLHAFTELNLQGQARTGDALPDNVHSAVLARIDLLSRQERSMLQAAAVGSRAFRTSMLHYVMNHSSETEIATALNGLLARDMIVQLEHERYAFRHILIRDVAYGTLSRAERIRLHSKIAHWLELYAGSRLDEYIELIAYHYRESIQLSRQSTVPLALPFKKEDAAHVFARAGVLAGRTGSYAEARDYLQLAIDLLPPDEHMLMYEQLGDSVLWGSIPMEAYDHALQSWRAGTAREPAIGARLIRKLLTASTRVILFSALTQEQVEALRQEALALLEKTGDEDERWRIRVTTCFDPNFRTGKRRFLVEEMLQFRAQAWEAAAYFEQRKYWEALSETLDGYASLSFYLGKFQDAFEASQRRLAIPDLSSKEWADAVSQIVSYYNFAGDYTNCIAYAKEIFAHLKPGQPVANLGYVAVGFAQAAFYCGQWSEVEKLIPKLDEIRKLVSYDHQTTAYLLDGYLVALWIALAHEDRPKIDALSAIIRQNAAPLGSNFLVYLDALLADDVQRSPQDLTKLNDTHLIALFLFLNEHGKPMPSEISQMIQEAASMFNNYNHFSEISLALEKNDNARLAKAIDEAEASQLIVHAARVRLILAQRTNDRTQLERARPVLLKLGDRMYLRKLEEIMLDLP